MRVITNMREVLTGLIDFGPSIIVPSLYFARQGRGLADLISRLRMGQEEVDGDGVEELCGPVLLLDRMKLMEGVQDIASPVLVE